MIALRTPCKCSRAVRGVEETRTAIQFVHRTCPKCRARWQVRVTPIRQGAVRLDRADWLCVRGAA
jgi:hypothetical protein